MLFVVLGTPPPIPIIKPKQIDGNVDWVWAVIVAVEVVLYTPEGKQVITIL
jgi:hypothetical protein